MKVSSQIIALLAIVTVPVLMAADAPTVYGRVNKEIRNVSQNKRASKASTTGVRDVSGAETLLGVKGNVPADMGAEARYTIELGLNSNLDNGGVGFTGSPDANTGERIRIRQAKVDLINSWGAVSLGQTWALDASRQMSLDPLSGTGAELLGLDSTDMNGSVAGMFGMRTRYIVDALQYRMEKNGIGFGLSWDNNNASDGLSKAAYDDATASPAGTTSVARAQWYTAMLTYDHDFSALTVNAHAVYSKGIIEDGSASTTSFSAISAGNPTPDLDSYYWTLASKFSFNDFVFSAAYSKSMEGQYDTNLPLPGNMGSLKNRDRKHLLATLSYKISDKWTAAVNYGKTNFEDGEYVTTNTNVLGGSQSTLALGVIHNCSSNIKSRLIYMVQKREALTISGQNSSTNDVLAMADGGTEKENTAKSIIAGLTLSF